MIRRCAALVVVTGALVGCSRDGTAPSDRDRAWGRAKVEAETRALASEPLAVERLPDDRRARARVFGMSFEEVVARLGPARFEGTARFRMLRRGHDLEVTERTVIESGSEGDLHVVQRDEDDRLLREGFRIDGDWFVRHEAGRLQTTDYAQGQLLRLHEEAFEPLGVTLRQLGADWILGPRGRRSVDGRPAIGFGLASPPSPTPVQPDGFDEAVVADRVEGAIWVDAETAVVLSAEVEASFRWTESRGRFEMSLGHRVRPSAPRTFDVASAEPLPPRPPINLDPLEFLDELTQTSTIIGGDEP